MCFLKLVSTSKSDLQ